MLFKFRQVNRFYLVTRHWVADKNLKFKSTTVYCAFTMKFLLLVCFATFIAFAIAAGGIEDCKCFAEFKPEKEGDNWICRGVKNFRIYGCGEEQPPVCKCYSKGKEVVLDIGETNCVGMHDSIYCAPTDEWNSYLSRHPEKRIYS